MQFKKILITGGAGFVGSSLAIYWKKRFKGLEILVLDNLSRSGSELQVPRLQEHEIKFIQGDVRNPEILDQIEAEIVVDCAAEPSVQAGLNQSPRYLIETNLTGTLNCLEWARVRGAGMYFLSSSRVYPIERLGKIPWVEDKTRYEWGSVLKKDKDIRSLEGLTLDFPTVGVRSLYGTTKLCSEYLIQEYAKTYDLPSIITRFGVIAGPWQMGRADQGIFAFWVARHFFGGSLTYTGFGGEGKQVRDFLHIDDVCELVTLQLGGLKDERGEVYIGSGGRTRSVSLNELTQICTDVTGRHLGVSGKASTHSNDLRILLMDSQKARERFGWKPLKDGTDVVGDIFKWMHQHEVLLKPILSGT
jgi:CDP-paratose 2-epimerase